MSLHHQKPHIRQIPRETQAAAQRYPKYTDDSTGLIMRTPVVVLPSLKHCIFLLSIEYLVKTARCELHFTHERGHIWL